MIIRGFYPSSFIFFKVNNKPMSSSETIQASIGALAGIAVVIWLQFGVFNKHSVAESMVTKIETANLSDPIISQTAEYLNKDCPKMVDKITRMDSVVSQPGKVFAQYYTLINTDAASVDTASYRGRMTEGITNNIKTNAGLKIFRDAGVTFKYYYRDQDGRPFVFITVTPEQYNN
jgi:hypothetical protein